MLETMVFTELKRRGYFVIRKRGVGAWEPYQVCLNLTTENATREISSLPTVAKFLGCDRATVIVLDEEKEFSTDGVKIRIVPAWKWLLEE